MFKIIKIILHFATRTNERLQQMFLQIVLMVAIINGETISHLQEVEVLRRVQHVLTRVVIDLEIIIVVIDLLQQQMIEIGVPFKMTIFGDE